MPLRIRLPSALKPLGYACALLLLAPAPAAAQAPGQAFETLELRLSGTLNLNDTRFHRYWKPGAGGALTVSTPFYLGVAEVGGLFHHYAPAREDVPRFNALLVFAGWGVPARPTPWLSWYGGIRIGTYRMVFDEDTFPGVRNETELTLAAYTRIEVFARRGLGVHASGTYLKVYTFPRLELAYASVGLTYRLNTPGWLKTFLR